MILLGGGQHPFHGFFIVLRHAEAVLIHDGQPVLGFGIALMGEWAEQLGGAGELLRLKGGHRAVKFYFLITIKLVAVSHYFTPAQSQTGDIYSIFRGDSIA